MKKKTFLLNLGLALFVMVALTGCSSNTNEDIFEKRSYCLDWSGADEACQSFGCVTASSFYVTEVGDQQRVHLYCDDKKGNNCRHIEWYESLRE